MPPRSIQGTFFFEVQKEISKAFWYCGLEDIKKVDGRRIFTVTHKNKRFEVKTKYKVMLRCFMYSRCVDSVSI